MTPPDDLVRLRHLRDAAEKAIAFSAGKTRQSLDDDELLRLGLTKLVETRSPGVRRMLPSSLVDASTGFRRFAYGCSSPKLARPVQRPPSRLPRRAPAPSSPSSRQGESTGRHQAPAVVVVVGPSGSPPNVTEKVTGLAYSRMAMISPS